MNRLTVLISGVIASLPLSASPVLPQAEVPQPLPQLEGAWQVVVTLRVDAPDCKTAEIVGFGPNPFPSFNTFHRGGTMSEFGTRVPPAARTPGHGVWKRTGERSFVYRSEFFIFDGNGLVAASMDIRSKLRLALTGNRFTGISRLVMTDVSGNEQPFCATLSGERIRL